MYDKILAPYQLLKNSSRQEKFWNNIYIFFTILTSKHLSASTQLRSQLRITVLPAIAQAAFRTHLRSIRHELTYLQQICYSACYNWPILLVTVVSPMVSAVNNAWKLEISAQLPVIFPQLFEASLCLYSLSEFQQLSSVYSSEPVEELYDLLIVSSF